MTLFGGIPGVIGSRCDVLFFHCISLLLLDKDLYIPTPITMIIRVSIIAILIVHM